MSENTENNTNTGTTLFSEVLFNIPRHNLITAAAYQLLNANAKAKVDQMLGSVNMNAGNWGGWADQIKGANPPNDAETSAFLQNAANKKHKPWHYVNLPLEAAGYQAAAADGLTRDDDVVQMYKKCVLVLKGSSTRFSRVNALRMVGHLVGDIHQPLHIGCSFIDDSTMPPTLVFDQQTVVSKNLKKKSDTGGNKILLPNAGNMHSFWDGSLSGSLSGVNLFNSNSAKEKQLIRTIYNGAKKLGEKSAGTIGLAAQTALEDLAQDWANDSLKISRKAYQNIKMVAKQGANYKVEFKTTKTDYITKFRPIILKQMKLAARRLADLLNAIYP
ncbi:MAG: S1/P1 nuclease [Acidobacteriota bacterium]|nr:S1/P1 nuclease [Acidobacteriota bacterium]